MDRTWQKDNTCESIRRLDSLDCAGTRQKRAANDGPLRFLHPNGESFDSVAPPDQTLVATIGTVMD
jgi:hypothetical protein